MKYKLSLALIFCLVLQNSQAEECQQCEEDFNNYIYTLDPLYLASLFQFLSDLNYCTLNEQHPSDDLPEPNIDGINRPAICFDSTEDANQHSDEEKLLCIDECRQELGLSEDDEIIQYMDCAINCHDHEEEDEWPCENDGVTDLIEYFYFNGECEYPAQDIVDCFNTLLPLVHDNESLYNVFTDVNDDQISVNFQNLSSFVQTENCSAYQLLINEELFEQEDLEQTNTSLENQNDDYPTVQLNIPISSLLEFGCEEEDLSDEINYTCPSQFQIITNSTAQYIESFDLVVNIKKEGFVIQDSVVLNVETVEINSEDQEINVDLDTSLVICSEGSYDPNYCAEISGTLDDPYKIYKGSQLNLRHKINDGYYSTLYTLEVDNFKFGPFPFATTKQNQGLGFVDFSFIPTISGELMEFKVWSILTEQQRRLRILQGQENIDGQQVVSQGFVIVRDSDDSSDLKGQERTEIIVQKEDEDSDVMVIVAASAVSVLFLIVFIGGIFCVYYRMKQKQKKSKYQTDEQQQQAVQNPETEKNVNDDNPLVN